MSGSLPSPATHTLGQCGLILVDDLHTPICSSTSQVFNLPNGFIAIFWESLGCHPSLDRQGKPLRLPSLWPAKN